MTNEGFWISVVGSLLGRVNSSKQGVGRWRRTSKIKRREEVSVEVFVRFGIRSGQVVVSPSAARSTVVLETVGCLSSFPICSCTPSARMQTAQCHWSAFVG
jgi:hypothetical protein